MKKKQFHKIIATISLFGSTVLLSVAPISLMTKVSANGVVNINEWETTVNGDTTILTNYIGQAKDVIVPLSGDLGTMNVKITKEALRAAATSANSQEGTLVNSLNDVAGTGLVADNSTDGNPSDTTVDYSGTFKDLTKITKIDLSQLKIEAYDGANGQDVTGEDATGEDGQPGESIDVSSMFENCMSLKEVDMSSFVGQGGIGGNGGNGTGGNGTGGTGGDGKGSDGKGGNAGFAGNFISKDMFKNTFQLVEIHMSSFIGQSGIGGIGGNGYGGTGTGGIGGDSGIVGRGGTGIGGTGIGGIGYTGGIGTGGIGMGGTGGKGDSYGGKGGTGGNGGEGKGGTGIGGNGYGGKGGTGIGGEGKGGIGGAGSKGSDGNDGTGVGGRGGNGTGGNGTGGTSYGDKGGNGIGGIGTGGNGGNGYASGNIGINGTGGTGKGGNGTGGTGDIGKGGTGIGGEGNGGIAGSGGYGGSDGSGNGGIGTRGTESASLLEKLSENDLQLYLAYTGTTDKTDMFFSIAVNEVVITKRVGFSLDELKENVGALRAMDSGKGENIRDLELANVTISAVNKDGNAVDLADVSKNVGEYTITYTYNGKTVDTHLIVESGFIDTQDLTLGTGDEWKPEDNFVSAKNENQQPITFDQLRVTGADQVDLSKAGVYMISFSYQDVSKTLTADAKVNVIDIQTKSLVLDTGNPWKPYDALVSVTNVDQVEHTDQAYFEQNVKISVIDKDSGSSVDITQLTENPGTYIVTYTYEGISRSVDILVEKTELVNKFILPSNIDFGTPRIQYEKDQTLDGQTNGKPTEGKIEVKDTRSKMGEGYKVKVSQTQQFTGNNMNKELNATLFFKTGTLTNSENLPIDGGNQTIQLIPGQEIIVLATLQGQSRGTTTLPLHTFQLLVPKEEEKQKDVYKTILTWSLSDTP